MENFYDLLQEIRSTPKTYLGNNSIFNLQGFLDGYYFARRELGITPTEQENEFQQFLLWISEKFQVETEQLWTNTILCNSSDQCNAVEIFFSLFDEFINQQNIQKA